MVRWLKRLTLLLVLLVVAAALAAWLVLRASLPTLDGSAPLPGLMAPASIERDALGVATIRAGSEVDAMRALGYVHAQERFFEMDLMRRTAAGELAELFGPIALDTDRGHRVHRLRARVTGRIDAIAGDMRPQLEAYVEGVNAGLAALDARPWPYLLLGQQPAPWRIEDSALIGFAMYFDLQDESNARERALAHMRPHLPSPLYALLTHGGTRWDAPLQGAERGDAALPGPDQVDLWTLPSSPRDTPVRLPDRGTPGSNSFAVSGTRTADGRAIVANDMHLGLRAPNLWFRARLHYADARAHGGRVDITGFTLPGMPAVVVGSNGRIAWGFTNSYIDTADWALQEVCGSLLDEACVRPRTTVETIAVAGADEVAFEVAETDWGPVLHRERRDGRDYVHSLRWAAHLPGALSLDMAGFAHAGSLDAALAMADHIAIPTQNLMLADRNGRIGWRLLGPVPDRGDRCPASTGIALSVDRIPDLPLGRGGIDAYCHRWALRSDDSPSIVDPEDGRLWTANARVADGEDLQRLGDGGYAFGARARQIRDGLRAKPRLSERDLLAIQLDDRAVFLDAWHALLRERAQAQATPALTALAEAAGDWSGRASTESAGYRLVRAWRLAVHARIADGLTAAAQATMGEAFEMPDLPQFEGVVWPLVTTRPAHLLSRRYTCGDGETGIDCGWAGLFEDAAREVRDGLGADRPLAARTWGERNAARICHPLAGALPLGRRLLCMPDQPLPGDGMMPRVQGPSFGASERMVVSPGREDDGIVHMPGGQSGHPLSPFWGAGHDDWVQGRPTPFLPGARTHALQLRPAPAGG